MDEKKKKLREQERKMKAEMADFQRRIAEEAAKLRKGVLKFSENDRFFEIDSSVRAQIAEEKEKEIRTRRGWPSPYHNYHRKVRKIEKSENSGKNLKISV